jgi:hypothetical protein
VTARTLQARLDKGTDAGAAPVDAVFTQAVLAGDAIDVEGPGAHLTFSQDSTAQEPATCVTAPFALVAL